MSKDNITQFHYSSDGSHLRGDPSVTKIPARAFQNRTGLIEVELPEGIKSVGDHAFDDCRSLRNVHLPEGLLTIGENSFAGCTQLEKVAVPSTVIDINNGAFHGCSSLKEINLCEGLRTIGHKVQVSQKHLGVFCGCSSLLRINIPSTVAVVTAWAFAGCTSLEEVCLHEGLQAIMARAFARCYSLRQIRIPSTVTDILDWAFDGCTSLEAVHLSEGLETIGRKAFRCKSLLRITIPSTVRAMTQAFNGCISLREVKFCEGLRNIVPCAFSGCYSLIRIEFPSTVISVGREAFSGCQSLKEIHLCEGIQTIGEFAFAGCKSLLSIHVPSSVTVIEYGTFENCEQLRNVTISPLSMLGQVPFEQPFPNVNQVNCTFDMLRNRFDDLPIHELCSVLSRRTTVSHDELRALMEMLELQPVDCLGMTPLHILACSWNHDVQLYQCYLERFPESMLVEDKWGETPLGYVILSEAPKEILLIFLEICKRKWGGFPFDVGKMFMKLKSEEFARLFIPALRRHFPNLVVNWQELLDESIASKVPLLVFKVLVESSISRRVNCMSTDRHLIISPVQHWGRSFGAEAYHCIRRLVIQFTQEYSQFLIESSTLLELALWKALLNESLQQTENTIREDTRVNGGQMFQVVIPNVLKFL